jgi:hypothetical protein
MTSSSSSSSSSPSLSSSSSTAAESVLHRAFASDGALNERQFDVQHFIDHFHKMKAALSAIEYESVLNSLVQLQDLHRHAKQTTDYNYGAVDLLVRAMSAAFVDESRQWMYEPIASYVIPLFENKLRGAIAHRQREQLQRRPHV